MSIRDKTPALIAQTPDIQILKVDMLPDGRMDINNTAAYIGIKPRTLKDYRTKGLGPEFCRFGKKIFYYKVDVDKWLQAHRSHERQA